MTRHTWTQRIAPALLGLAIGAALALAMWAAWEMGGLIHA